MFAAASSPALMLAMRSSVYFTIRRAVKPHSSARAACRPKVEKKASKGRCSSFKNASAGSRYWGILLW